MAPGERGVRELPDELVASLRIHAGQDNRTQLLDVFDHYEHDPASFIAADLLLSLWRPFEADDEPADEQGFYFNSVLLAAPGYYDTPAQASERARGTTGRS